MAGKSQKRKSGLHACIVERATAIGCPAGYGAEQARKDSHRLEALLMKRDSPRGSLSAAEYAEEAQLTGWVVAFQQSPETRARDRIRELQMKSLFPMHGHWKISAAEQSELDLLSALYPDLPPDPDDPMAEVIERAKRKDKQTELDHLRTLYPGLPPDPDGLMMRNLK
jgi:hypothetical protein